ncbi:MAG: carbohydrate kinase family protein, partial [Proteobacteria bacterium]|nr:carbohydrate kinase family protein [Pseudomonadota bacterium]
MGKQAEKRFLFLGGIPVFDYLISVRMDEISRATQNQVLMVGDRILLPVGTVFRFSVQGSGETLIVNPMASREVQQVHDRSYYSLELGGKHAEQYPFTLCGDLARVAAELRQAFPALVQGEADLQVVEVAAPVQAHLGGNNKNIIEEIKTLYASPELQGRGDAVRFEHHFFGDTRHPKHALVEDLYRRLGVDTGAPEDMHVAGLAPRIGYVFTLLGDDGAPLDRVILASRTDEAMIPAEQLRRKYFALEYGLRRDRDFVETHLVVNSMTNPEEVRLVLRLLQTAYASGVTTTVCPTLTLLRCLDRLLDGRYFTTEKERFYEYRQDLVYGAILPFVQYLILNRDELTALDDLVTKRGIDATASVVANRMNRGRQAESIEGGKIVVTGGSKGARLTERLNPERARLFWEKANLTEESKVRFAERRLVCGDDYVTDLTTTLGAGDVFTGVFVGLNALGWDGGHALRAATLGAQHFIRRRTKPQIADMIATDEEHILLGTETELVDVISHHLTASGDPTRYGTISDTVITIKTTQIQHPF